MEEDSGAAAGSHHWCMMWNRRSPPRFLRAPERHRLQTVRGSMKGPGMHRPRTEKFKYRCHRYRAPYHGTNILRLRVRACCTWAKNI
jgi:hypothetical protein